MKAKEFPAPWDEERVKRVVLYYEQVNPGPQVQDSDFKLVTATFKSLPNLLKRRYHSRHSGMVRTRLMAKISAIPPFPC
ncbi:MAG: hypothetical protein JWM21_1960 [Acidobacteria bacterium]|nr:hypothetical protein [Acidobacteriota bacterium]